MGKLLITLISASAFISSSAIADMSVDLAKSLNTDPDYLIINIPPRAQAVPSSVYRLRGWLPILIGDLADKDLKKGDETSIDASAAVNGAGSVGANLMRVIGLSGSADIAAETSVLLPDAHSIEMVQDRIIDKITSSQEVQHACQRGEQMVVITKSYEGTPTVTMLKKEGGSAEAFEKAKLNAAQARADIKIDAADRFAYSAKSPIIFAFEITSLYCEQKKAGQGKYDLKMARLTSSQLAFMQAESKATTYAMDLKKGVLVGGAPMYSANNVVENAGRRSNHTTLVAAVKAAGLVDSLSGPGPFTIFAPTNKAFADLPFGTVDELFKPENKDKLTAILTYHVVPGKLTAKDLLAEVDAGGGKAELKTIEGGSLIVTKQGKGLDITDGKGDIAKVTQADIMQSNGVVHVINAVMRPD